MIFQRLLRPAFLTCFYPGLTVGQLKMPASITTIFNGKFLPAFFFFFVVSSFYTSCRSHFPFSPRKLLTFQHGGMV